MMFRPIRRIFLVLLLVSVSARGQIEEDNEFQKQRSEGPLAALKEKYEEMPPPGKFAATAVTGFVGSRLALKAFVGAAKIAGATFIA